MQLGPQLYFADYSRNLSLNEMSYFLPEVQLSIFTEKCHLFFVSLRESNGVHIEDRVGSRGGISPSWGFHLDFSLNIGTTASHVPYESLNQGHAIFMPDTSQTVSSHPLDLSWNSDSTPVLTSSLLFRHLSNGSISLVSLIPT